MTVKRYFHDTVWIDSTSDNLGGIAVLSAIPNNFPVIQTPN
jgi:hypothetical protein